MRIIFQHKLQTFAKRHADAANSIITWRRVVQEAKWEGGADILADFPKGKLIPGKRARFKITGNRYRLVIEVDYIDGIVEVRFIGTPSEYDRIDASSV